MTYIKFFEYHEEEAKRKLGSKKKGLVVTVSGLSGSGKSEAARLIAKQLSLEYYSMGSIMREMAKKKGITIEEFCKIRGDEVDYLVDKETITLALKGNVVLDARLSGWAAGDTADCRIFVFCPPEVRASRIYKRDNMEFEEALRSLMRRDMSDRSKYMKLYGIDMLEKKIYDRIIDNSGSLTELQSNVEKIAKGIHPRNAV